MNLSSSLTVDENFWTRGIIPGSCGDSAPLLIGYGGDPLVGEYTGFTSELVRRGNELHGQSDTEESGFAVSKTALSFRTLLIDTSEDVLFVIDSFLLSFRFTLSPDFSGP